MRRLASALCLSLLASPALAQAYRVHGAGAVSCGTWTTNRAKGGAVAAVMEAWVQGYVSGINNLQAVNDQVADVAAGTDDNGLFGWLDGYCEAHPIDSTATATGHLLGYLAHRTTDAKR